MSHPFEYDVFLSHSAKDKPAVRQLAARLRGDGLRVWLDEWVIQPGDAISLAIEQGLESSRTLVLVMSKNAFGSDWVTLERHTAFFRDPTNQQRRFIPLRLDNSDIKDVLRQFAYIDWRKKEEEEEQYLRLLQACDPARATEAEMKVAAANEPTQEVAAFVAEEPRRTAKLRVLVVDEMPLNRAIASQILAGDGHYSHVVGSANEALQASKDSPFDLILAQVKMSEGDAYALANALRANMSRIPEFVPILGMTNDKAAGQRWVDSGFDGNLSRPINLSEFREQIQALLSAVDISCALAKYGGDEEMLNTIMTKVVQEAPTIIREIRAAISQSDFGRLIKNAHGLRGSMITFGAKPVEELALRLQKMGASQVLSGAEQVLHELESRLGRVQFALAQSIQKTPPPT